MYGSQAPVRELYERIAAHGGDCFAGVLAPWLAEHASERAWLASVAAEDQQTWRPSDEELCRLYAFSRVNDLLLLRFQPVPPGRWPGPQLSLPDYGAFVLGLGLRVVEPPAFHPVFHEIVAVEPAEDPDAAIELVGTTWPCTMLGDLVFARAGTVIRAGARAIDPAIATTSTLYWAHRRQQRPAEDPSLGWGSNSQWRTSFRRDYVAASVVCFNADGAWNVREPSPVDARSGRDELSAVQREELLVHRCFVRSELPHGDRWPYDERLITPR